LIVLGVRECQNSYAARIDQLIKHTEEFDHSDWVKSSLVVSANTTVAPDGTTTADTITFDASFDNISQDTGVSVQNKAFTASVWLKVASGTQTVSLYVHNTAETQSNILQCVVTTTWQRFWVIVKFTNAVVDNLIYKLIRGPGDNATAILAWGANVYRNPSDVINQVYFPYTKRVAEAAATLAVQVSRCTVTDRGNGNRCYYSRPSCQDVDNFNAGHIYETTPQMRGIREDRFCRQNAPLILPGEGVRPYLIKMDTAAQAIDAPNAVTVNERMTLEFEDDALPGVWNLRQQGDGMLVNTATGVGTFWRRWDAIYRNYGNPEGYVDRKIGYVEAGLVESGLMLRGRYLIRNFETRDNRVKLVCSDRLKLTRKSIPEKIDKDNFVFGPLTDSVTTFSIREVIEVTTPAAGITITLELMPDTAEAEKVNVTSVDLVAGTVTVQRGRWGTTAVAHSMTQIEFRQIYEFGTERVVPSQQPLGKNSVDVIIEIYRYAGLKDSEIDLVTLQSERDFWLPSSVDPGAAGTEYGTVLRRTLTDVTDCESLVREIRELNLLFLWINDDQKLTGIVFAPIRPGVTPTEVSDDANHVLGTIETDDNDEDRISRVLVAYNAPPGTSPTKAEDYLEIRIELDVDSEEREYYGEPRLRALLTPWIKPLDTATAAYFTSHILARFRHGARVFKCEVEVKDDDIKIGDFIRVNTKKIQDFHGNPTNSVMHVIRKRPIDDNRIDIECLDAGLYHRYGFWSGPAVPVYTSASASEKVYGFWGDTNGMVGSPLELGYHWW
jgi:hypothetical protein